MQGDEGRVNREMPQEAGTIGKVQEVPCWSVGVICRENRWPLGRKDGHVNTHDVCQVMELH
jgi:hypothetical protein